MAFIPRLFPAILMLCSVTAMAQASAPRSHHVVAMAHLLHRVGMLISHGTQVLGDDDKLVTVDPAIHGELTRLLLSPQPDPLLGTPQVIADRARLVPVIDRGITSWGDIVITDAALGAVAASVGAVMASLTNVALAALDYQAFDGTLLVLAAPAAALYASQRYAVARRIRLGSAAILPGMAVFLFTAGGSALNVIWHGVQDDLNIFHVLSSLGFGTAAAATTVQQLLQNRDVRSATARLAELRIVESEHFWNEVRAAHLDMYARDSRGNIARVGYARGYALLALQAMTAHAAQGILCAEAMTARR